MTGPEGKLRPKRMADLSNRGCDMRAVYTGDGDPEDRYAIVRCGDVWEVFYTERGEKLGLRSFADESSACEYLERLLDADDTVRP